jgi:ABC-type antimicrobial peptide transport system permease subunit
VVVVNEAAARAYWPGGDALGQRVWTPWSGPDRLWTVVGVAKDTRYGELTDLRPTVYFPLRQVRTFHSNYLLVRTTGAGPPILQVVREALVTSGSGFQPRSAVSVGSRLAEPLARPRFSAFLLSIFAGIALLLATSGLYGIMAFLVRSRRREIGIRLACGATPTRAGARVLSQGVFIALAGAGVGLAVALASARALTSMLFGVTPSDPISLGVAVGISLATAVAACWIPARRAARIDPAVVLRGD